MGGAFVTGTSAKNAFESMIFIFVMVSARVPMALLLVDIRSTSAVDRKLTNVIPL